MPPSRFFLNEPFTKNKMLTIPDEECHHIQVMRKKADDFIEIVNGKNQLAIAKLHKINNESASAEIIQVIEDTPKTPRIILAQALIRSAKLDFILEKCTELGVSEFIIYKADKSEVEELSENKIQRFNSILISAIKQCGRLDLPKITIIDNLSKFKKADYTCFYGDYSSHKLLDINFLKESSKPVCFFIGPEQGFTEKDLSYLNHLKAAPIKINRNILRTETAAISAVALLSQLHLST